MFINILLRRNVYIFLCETCVFTSTLLGTKEATKSQNSLEDLRQNELWTPEDWTALCTFKGVQFVGLGSNLKTQNGAFWLATATYGHKSSGIRT